MMWRVLVVACAISLAGCVTSIGRDDPYLLSSTDFGPPATVKLCVFLDSGVSQSEASALLGGWDEEAAKYRLYVTPVSFEERPRSGSFYWEIMQGVKQIPLRPPCDRVMYFANARVIDVAYGIASTVTPLSQVFGQVDARTLTHGFVYARTAMPGQLAASPSDTVKHELYHMMGCAQHDDMERCYEQIKLLKQAARINKHSFFPTYENTGGILLTTRDQVNRALADDLGSAPAISSAAR